jgi:hypothetical protein
MKNQKITGKALRKRLKKAARKGFSISYAKYIIKGNGTICPTCSGSDIAFENAKTFCKTCLIRIT